jgi:hypothetical protein
VFRRVAVACAWAAWLLVASCASFSPPIPIATTAADAEMLAGEWYGDYTVDEPQGRRGTIVFKLVAGEDHAHGDVLMIPAGSTRAYERYHGDAPVRGRQTDPPSQVLTIRLVRASGGDVRGQLDPYWDPDRDCPATTTFRGRLVDGVIAGTFSTKFGTGVAEAAGRWRVTRLPARSR